MKSILIIGSGKFGRHLCRNLALLGNQIMLVDQVEENMEEMIPYVVSAKIGDCTNPVVLQSLGVDNYDLCFVCIGSNFQSSLEITSQLKEMGAHYVVSQASRDIQSKFLLRNGADDVIYPDRDIAEKMAIRYSANHVYDYIEVSDEFSIYEISPMKKWIGKSLRDSDIRSRYRVSVLAVKKGDKTSLMPMADYVIKEDEHLMIIGRKEDIDQVLEHIND